MNLLAVSEYILLPGRSYGNQDICSNVSGFMIILLPGRSYGNQDTLTPVRPVSSILLSMRFAVMKIKIYVSLREHIFYYSENCLKIME